MSKFKVGGDMGVRLTAKQKKFADEFIKTGNATQAAIKAGYSKNSARQMGNENLTKPYIKKYIDKKMKEIEDEQIAKAEEVLKYLTRVMRGEEKEIFVDYGEDGDKIVVEGPPAIRERTKAAELIGKRYTLFTDKTEMTGDLGLKVVVDYGEDEES